MSGSAAPVPGETLPDRQIGIAAAETGEQVAAAAAEGLSAVAQRIRRFDDRPASWEAEGLARELLVGLGDVQQILNQLLEAAGHKLAAMRRADAAALHECAAREDRLLRALFAREKQRAAVLAQLAQSLPCPQEGRVRISDVTQWLDEPLASQIRARVAGLRHTAAALHEKNRLAATVARNLHEHIRAVFRELAHGGQESGVYGPNGKHDGGETGAGSANWRRGLVVDAVG